MNNKIAIQIMVLMFSACSYQLRAADYYVSSVSELNALLAKVNQGDVIIWRNGFYKDCKIDFSPIKNGTVAKPIILKAQTAGKVSLSGNSQILIGGDYLEVEGFLFTGNCTLENNEHVIDFRASSKIDANHCRVTNCAVVNYSLTEESGKTNYFINLVGTYNEVDHCYFEGKTNKGPTLVVEYKMGKDYVPGSDMAPSAYHHIHHNYFGYRTFSTNGGEQMRIGTSTSSFTHGFNVIEYNYMEDERLEAEIISNKSWDNIYRFNTFYGNDGGLVIRHGQRCFVYGNYMNGSTGRNESAGLRVINPNNTVFNNYVENLEGGNKGLKSPITIMSGLIGSALNEYYPADNAIVAYNTVVNSVGPAINVGAYNAGKGKPSDAPKNVWVACNTIIHTIGKDIEPVVISDKAATYQLKDNIYTNGTTGENGFVRVSEKRVTRKDGFSYVSHAVDRAVINSINQRLAIHRIRLTDKEITQFDPKWKLNKKDVGVSWIKN